VNLQYNDSSALPFYSLDGVLTGNASKSDADALFYNRTGPLTANGRDLTGWFSVPYRNDTSKYMVIQTICSTPTKVNGIFLCQFNLNEGLLSRGRIALGSDSNLTFAEGVAPG
jgi:cellobiose dehydrogenase (acceptor)